MNVIVVVGSGLEEGTVLKEKIFLNTVLDAKRIFGTLSIHKSELKDLGPKLGSGMNAS
jgi:hypothetical protein